MTRISIAKGAFAVALAVACIGVLASCSGSTSESDTSGYTGLTGGVAATVNGVEIKEDTITEAIEDSRASYFYMYYYYFDEDLTEGQSDEEQWASYFDIIGETPEELRSDYIDTYVDQELVLQYASERGVDVSDETVEEKVAEMRDNYDTEAKWQEALSSLGITEQEYRDDIKYDLTYDDVYDSFAVEVAEPGETTEEDLIAYAQEYAKDLYDDARRSSHVLFDLEDEATAEEVLAQIKAGEIDLAAAAEEYSTDTGSASEGGDVGWDCLTTFVDEYQDALDKLSVGEISDLVESEYGYHIIECTDLFVVPDEVTSVDDWPEAIVEDMEDNLVTEAEDAAQEEADQEQADGYDEWFEECRDKADIVINAMPSDVPYNVDLSLYADHFTTEDQEQLSELGFDEEDIEFLEEHYDDMINALGAPTLLGISRGTLEYGSLYQDFVDDGFDEDVADKMALFLTDPASFFSDDPESVTDEEIDEVWDTIDKLAEKDVEEEADEESVEESDESDASDEEAGTSEEATDETSEGETSESSETSEGETSESSETSEGESGDSGESSETSEGETDESDEASEGETSESGESAAAGN